MTGPNPLAFPRAGVTLQPMRHTRRRSALSVITAAIAGVAILCAPALAASLSVTTGADTVANDGACSLREAVRAANTDTPSGAASGECPPGVGQDVILLPAGTFTLSIAGFDDTNAAGDLDVTEALTVQGAGAGSTTIDGGGIDRVLDVIGAGTAHDVKGVTITGGRAQSGSPGGDGVGGSSSPGSGGTGGGAVGGSALVPGADGGAIRNNAGTLTVEASVLTGNSAGDGGRGGDGTGGAGGSGAGHGGADGDSGGPGGSGTG